MNKNLTHAKFSSKQQICSQKLKTIDRHIFRTQKQSTIIFNSRQLLQNTLIKNNQIKSIRELALNEIASIIFYDFNQRIFKFHYLPLQQSKAYCLQVQSKKKIQIRIKFDNKSQQRYEIINKKGIIIKDKGWNQFQIHTKISEMGLFSIVKIQISTIKLQFKTRSISTSPRKGDIKKQIDQFIQDNRQGIKSIIQKRQSHHETNFINRNASSTRLRSYTSQGSRTFKISSVHSKRQLISFESSKSLYLKHINKMSPVKSTNITQKRKIFIKKRNDQLKKLVSIIQALSILDSIYIKNVNHTSKIIKQLKLNSICMKFIKKLKIRNKSKGSNQIKCKLAIESLLPIYSIFCIKQSKQKAKKILVDNMRALLFYTDGYHMCWKSFYYKRSVKFVQRWWRNRKNKNILEDDKKQIVKEYNQSQISSQQFRDMELEKSTRQLRNRNL